MRRGIALSSVEVMLASLSNKTRKQYDSVLKHWCAFCKEHEVDPLSASVPIIISYLTTKFKEGLSYSSLNSMRSALSLIIGPHVGVDDRIKRFFRGIFKLRPKKPKYEEVWDPCIVLNYLSTLYPNDDLNLEVLTKKMVTLLALVTAHRVQTLSLIRIENICINKENISIKIPDSIKTSGPHKLQPKLILPYFKENLNICPATTLLFYLDATKYIRINNCDCDKLILTFKKPCHPASSASISRWIKQTLSVSGIDVTKYSAHSTRHAATSKASDAGVNIEIIRKSAGWSNNSTTFARFYKRPIISDPNHFAQAVCGLNDD